MSKVMSKATRLHNVVNSMKHYDQQNYEYKYNATMNSNSISFRMKGMLKELDRADCLDALLEAEQLVVLLKQKWEEVASEGLQASVDNVKSMLSELVK